MQDQHTNTANNTAIQQTTLAKDVAAAATPSFSKETSASQKLQPAQNAENLGNMHKHADHLLYTRPRHLNAQQTHGNKNQTLGSSKNPTNSNENQQPRKEKKNISPLAPVYTNKARTPNSPVTSAQ